MNFVSPRKQFRVLFPHQFPHAATNCGKFPHLHRHKGCEFPGLMVEIIKLIADQIGADLVVKTLYTKEDEYSTGIIENNRTTGLLGYVSNDIVDTLAYPLQQTKTRDLVFEFSEILYYVESNILHKRHSNNMNFLWAFFTIYDSISWSMMGAILLLQGLFYIAHQYCQDSIRYTFDEITDSFWEAMQLHLGRSVPIKRRIYAVKFNVIISHFFHYVILLGVYSSWLFSKKVIVNKTERLEGFSEMIKELEKGRRYFMCVLKELNDSGFLVFNCCKTLHSIIYHKKLLFKDWFFETVRDSNSYPFKDIRDTLKDNPIIVTGNKRKTMQLASETNAMALIMEDNESNYISKSFCGLVRMSEPVSVSTAHLIFRKGSSFLEPVNEAIRNNTVQILSIFRKYKDYMKRLRPRNCDDGTITVNNHVVLPYYGLMIAWAGCIVTSSIFFALEICIFYAVRQWRRLHVHRKQPIYPLPIFPGPK